MQIKTVIKYQPLPGQMAGRAEALNPDTTLLLLSGCHHVTLKQLKTCHANYFFK